MQRKLPCVYMRGGTSKACFFRKEDLPADPLERERIILRVFGSPDKNQINGMGGATPTTSKVAIISRSDRPDADIHYEFGQVGIDSAYIDQHMNCGNISSAVGPYAVDEGLVQAVEPITAVRIYNSNTDKIIVAHVPVKNGHFAPEGSYQIDGVPGSGAKIRLEFCHPEGAATGVALPTGHAMDQIEIDGEIIPYSFVDAGNPIVFVEAQKIGLTGLELPSEYEKLSDIVAIKRRLERIRGTCAIAAGLAKDLDDARVNSPVLPKVICFQRPASYTGSNGKRIHNCDIDLAARFISIHGKMAPAFAVTGGICTAVAANISGTVVNQILGANENGYPCVRIGHPCGVMDVETTLEYQKDGPPTVLSCIIGRTARKIMDGYVYVDEPFL